MWKGIILTSYELWEALFFVWGFPSSVSKVLMQIHSSILDYSIHGSQCLGLLTSRFNVETFGYVRERILCGDLS